MTGQGRLTRDPGGPHQTPGARAGPPSPPRAGPGNGGVVGQLLDRSGSGGIAGQGRSAAAPEFLAHCQTAEQTATIAALNKWAHCESVGLTLRWMQRYDKCGLYKGYNRVQLEPLQLTTTFCPTLWSHLCSQRGQGRHVISLRVLPTVQLGPGRAPEGGRPSHLGRLG